MKRKFFALFLATLMFIPIISVRAEDKATAILSALKESAKAFGGKVTLEDDYLGVEWSALYNSKDTMIEIGYNNDVISFNCQATDDYDEAASYTSGLLYFIEYILPSVLVLNGYTMDEIRAFLNQSEYVPTMVKNGISFEDVGSEVIINNEDGSLTYQPMIVSVNIKKANLHMNNEDIVDSETTIDDVVDYLNNLEGFVSYEVDGKEIYSHFAESDDENIIITRTDNIYKDYYVSFGRDENVLSYEVDEINDFDEAENVLSHEMFADMIISSILKINGYTTEQISDFAKDNKFEYDLNGIEIKELGEAKKYSNEDTSYIIAPVSIKIDLDKANLNRRGENGIIYTVLSGENQEYDTKAELGLIFRFSIDYDLFKNTGKLYIDGIEVLSDKYEITKGSTIVTINNEYAKELVSGSHTITAKVGDDSVEAKFTVINGKSVENKEENPKTIDNILSSLFVLLLSVLGFVILYKKKT